MINFGKIAILGDSYSTFDGYVPKGYAVYYGAGREDVVSIEAQDTWWLSLANKTNSEVVINNSWSGSAIARITYGGEYEVRSSFPQRIQNEVDLSLVDTLFIFGGTNDFWAGSPLGELKYDGITEEDLKNTLPSFCFILNYVKKVAPKVRVVTVVNSELGKEITNGLIEASKRYDVDYIVLKDISKQNGHPDKLGMEQIANQIIEYFNKF